MELQSASIVYLCSPICHQTGGGDLKGSDVSIHEEDSVFIAIVSLLHLMLDVWKNVRDALHVLADHTHMGGQVGVPDQSAAVHGHAEAVEEDRGKLEGITG